MLPIVFGAAAIGAVVAHVANRVNEAPADASPPPVRPIDQPGWSIERLDRGHVQPTFEAQERRALRLDTTSASVVVEDVVSRSWSRTVSVGAEFGLSVEANAKIRGLVEAGVRAALEFEGRWTQEEAVTERKSISTRVDPGGAVEVLVTWHRLEQHGLALLSEAPSVGTARRMVSVPYRAIVGLTCDVKICDLRERWAPAPPPRRLRRRTSSAPVLEEPWRPARARPPRAPRRPVAALPSGRSVVAAPSRTNGPSGLVDEVRYFGVVAMAVVAMLLLAAVFI